MASDKPLDALFVELAVGGVWLELFVVLLEEDIEEGIEEEFPLDKLLGSWKAVFEAARSGLAAAKLEAL